MAYLTKFQQIRERMKANPSLLLIIGVGLMSLSHLTLNVAFIGWFCMVPFLIYCRTQDVRFKWLKFIVALLVAWSLIVFKIITDPIPMLFVFLYSVPIMLIHLPGYILWSIKPAAKWSAFIFPASMVVLEWVQYTYTPLGSWGSAAYTQMGQLAILQGLSLFGMAGLSFLVYSVNVWLAGMILSEERVKKQFVWVVPIFAALLIYGELRIDLYRGTDKKTITTAAIGTDSEAGGLPLPTYERNLNDFNSIKKRTLKAARFGAKLAVWTEAAFFTEKEYESKWIDSMKAIAKTGHINLVASYVNLVETDPLKYENKYHFIDSTGTIRWTYHKHEPVPGEPAIKGTEEWTTIKVNESNVGGAICYDYDFPYVAKGYGNQSADIIGLPSSDWRGIDPLHAEMAAFRAIEQGQSIVRATRFGLSAAIDPMGTLRGQRSSYDQNEKILIAELPAKGVRTVYSIIGDVVIYLSLLIILIWAVQILKNKK